MFIERNRGKDITALPKSYTHTGKEYLITTKYDGHYIQIHKQGTDIQFFTSGGKEFFLHDVAEELRQIEGDFILACEYLGDSEGMQGDRRFASTATYRTDFTKGKTSNLGTNKIVAWDVIDVAREAKSRMSALHLLCKDLKTITPVDYLIGNIETANVIATKVIAKGREGVFCTDVTSHYRGGKRSNYLIKIKHRPTVDLECVGITKGEGKYEGKIGALILQDSVGRVVSVGSGLSDYLRDKPASYFLAKIVEISYEQILDTYIQPVYIDVREDKTESD